MHFTLLSFWLFMCGVPFTSAARNPIHLVNNTYTNLLIAINENIEEDHDIIKYLQELYVDASADLYQATNQRAMYGEITILIPESWSDAMTKEKATTETFESANIIVDVSHPDYEDAPYVKQTRPCGENGEYMHLTPRWILDRDWAEYTYGKSSKVLVHEWAHMQWGLFIEYPDDTNKQYYLDANGTVEPTRCSLAITGKSYDFTNCDRKGCARCNTDPESGVIPDPWCVYIPDETNQGTGSYLYANYLESVVEFCHSDPAGNPNSKHNPVALTKQNELCQYRSAWDVMLTTKDFINDNNPPIAGLNTMPTFKIVRNEEFRTVLVMDLSGSMIVDNRANLQHQAASKYIANTLPLNSWVGIVQFSDDATTLAPLTKIVDDEARRDLVALLPKSPTGSTCIGCGLRQGVQVFENSIFGSGAGGIIFLTTDGEENLSPYIDDVLPDLILKEVIVDTLAFSESADPKLVEVSDKTGGNSCWYSEADNSTALNDCFTASVTERTSSRTDIPVQIASKKTTIVSGAATTGTVHVDSSIGRDTVFFFFWDFSSTVAVDVIITRPDGVTIDSTNSQYNRDDNTKAIFIKIDRIAEAGEWLYEITNPGFSSQVVEVSVDSKSVDSSTQPIRLSSTPSTDYVTDSPPMAIIYAEVNQGYSPVLDAKVVATVERPSPHSPVDVQLFDSGTGADLTKDDGIYSGYFVDFVEATCVTECRYNIQVKADDSDQTAEIRTISRTGAMPRNYTLIPRKDKGVPIGFFSRVVQGGMIQVNNAVEYVNWTDPTSDVFPPSRVTGLVVTSTSYDNVTVTLQWTATGDDFDIGTASLYDLRYDTNFGRLANSFDDCYQLSNDNLTAGTLTAPKESRETETVTVQLSSSGPGLTYYFSIRAIDEAGNKGESSSIAQASIVAAPSVINEPVEEGLEGWLMALIIVGGVIVCVSTIGVSIWMCKCLTTRETISKVEPSTASEMENRPQESIATVAHSTL